MSFPKLAPVSAACLAAALALAAPGASAAPVTVTAAFTSFTSWMGVDRVSYVNGIALTAGSTAVQWGLNNVPTQYWSNTVDFGPAGVSRLDFNYATPNALVNTFDFLPGSADVQRGETFTLGTFKFINGQWWQEADIGVRLTTHSADAALDGHVLAATLHLTSNSAPSFPWDPYLEADMVYVAGRPDLGSMRVFDKAAQPAGNPGFEGLFAFDGYVGSLVLSDLRSINAAGFTDASIAPALAQVPEPGGLALVLGGLVAAGATSRRQALRGRS